MLGTQAKNLQDNLNIDAHIILHMFYTLMGIDHVFDIPHAILARINSSQDYALRADLFWHQITLGMSTTRSIP